MDRLDLLRIKLMEECAEVSQATSKCLRFGNEHAQEPGGRVNIDRLRDEVLDLFVALEAIRNEGFDLFPNFSDPRVQEKMQRLEHYMEISKRHGQMTPHEFARQFDQRIEPS